MEEDQEICRVCRCESTAKNPLYHPCKCSGSIRFVHQDCLLEWLSHSKKKYCELCEHPFLFTPIYRQDMPNQIPLYLLTGQCIARCGTILKTGLRAFIVTMVWLVLLPYMTLWSWRFYFWSSDNNIQGGGGDPSSRETSPSFLEQNTNGLWEFLADCFKGQVITLVIIIVGATMHIFKEWVDQNIPMETEQDPFEQDTLDETTHTDSLDEDVDAGTISALTRQQIAVDALIKALDDMQDGDTTIATDQDNDIRRQLEDLQQDLQHELDKHKQDQPSRDESIHSPAYDAQDINNTYQLGNDEQDEDQVQDMMHSIMIQDQKNAILRYSWDDLQNSTQISTSRILYPKHDGLGSSCPAASTIVNGKTSPHNNMPCESTLHDPDLGDLISASSSSQSFSHLLSHRHKTDEITYLARLDHRDCNKPIRPTHHEPHDDPTPVDDANHLLDEEGLFDFGNDGGILEAIGMRGSPWLLLQNSLLVLILLSFGLGIAVWLPYTLGRVMIFIVRPHDWLETTMDGLRSPTMDYILDRVFFGQLDSDTLYGLFRDIRLDRAWCFLFGYSALLSTGAWYLARANHRRPVLRVVIQQQCLVIQVVFFMVLERVMMPVLCGAGIHMALLENTVSMRWTYPWCFVYWLLGRGFISGLVVTVDFIAEIVHPILSFQSTHSIQQLGDLSLWLLLTKTGTLVLVYMAVIGLGFGTVARVIRQSTSLSTPLSTVDLLAAQFLLPILASALKPRDALKQAILWSWHTVSCWLGLFGQRFPLEEGRVLQEKEKCAMDNDKMGQTRIEDQAYPPPRMGLFLILMWLSGCAITVAPVLFGRAIFDAGHDLYAIVTGAVVLGCISLRGMVRGTRMERQHGDRALLHSFWNCVLQKGMAGCKMIYMLVVIGFVAPFLLGVAVNLYVFTPIQCIQSNQHELVLHLSKDWSFGVIYLGIIHGVLSIMPMNGWTLDQYLDGLVSLDVWTLTRRIVGPWALAVTGAITVPGGLAWILMQLINVHDGPTRMMIFSCAYPIMLCLVAVFGVAVLGMKLVLLWMRIVKDDAYLVGKQLHNLDDRPLGGPLMEGGAIKTV